MIRRKIWATATFCLAVAGAAHGQTGSAPSYPQYTPRGYTAPTPPSYAAPTPNLAPSPVMAMPAPMPAPMPVVEDQSLQFAADTAPKVQTVPAPAAPMVTPLPAPMAVPMPPQPMPGAPMLMPGAPPGTFTQVPMNAVGMPVPTGPLVSGPINGGPILEGYGGAPFLDGAEGAMPSVWASGEYINWRFRGAHLPPLVSIAPAGGSGILGDPGTAVVFGGGGDHQSDWQSGFRVRAGTWLEGGSAGIDAGFFYLGSVKSRFNFGSNGDPGIFRPFFNTATGAEDAALVAFVDPVAGPILSGRVTVQTATDLWGTELNYRTGWTTGFGGRFDALVGARYARLQDDLSIQSDLTTLTPVGAAPAGTSITVTDHFKTINQFAGGQIGMVGEWQQGKITFGLRGTIAAGATFQRIDISGVSTSVTPAGFRVSAPGGILALPSNSGTHDRTVFSILPEAGGTMGYQVTNCLRIFGGYNVMSWTDVARAGEQINRKVNGTFIPDPTTGTSAGTGPLDPRLHHHDSSFWVHGWSAGAEWRW